MNVWDKKEEEIFSSLTKSWEEFTAPGVFEKGVQKVSKMTSKIIPKKFQNKMQSYVDDAMSAEVILKVLTTSTKGLGELGKSIIGYTLSKQRIEKLVSKRIGEDCNFDSFHKIKSYKLEKGVMGNNKIRQQFLASIEGGATGFFGVYGIPFNIALSFLIYYRSVQYIALCYGYDALEDPREMEIASEVLINCLSPNIDTAGGGVSSFMGRCMLSAEMSSLGAALALGKKFEHMAKEGGAQLFYTQIRALAHKAAQKGLNQAGEKGIQNTFLKKILENLGKKLPKESAGRAIPFLGAFFGAGFDTYYMTRIVNGANLQYHKRFLIEKKANQNTDIQLHP